MVYFEKSQPAPTCLETEKAKASGDYKCGDVLQRLSTDFKKKCYICERKDPSSVNVEHFVPHKGNKDLKFDWNNLFWACGHCNNIKLDKHTNLLNCTLEEDDLENKIKLSLKPFPKENVQITILDNSQQTINTKELLLAVYNGTTKQKQLESAGLRDSILKEICTFQEVLICYFDDTNTPEDTANDLRKIRQHLSRASSYTAFKRWIIKDNENLRREFEQYFD